MRLSRSLLVLFGSAAWLGCSGSSITVSDGTDDVVTDAAPRESASKKKKVVSEDPDAPLPPVDAGTDSSVAAKDAAPEPPMSLVTPRLTESQPGVFTIAFRLHNASSVSSFRAFTTIKLKAAVWSFPTVDSVVCPETTPGYQWTVPPAGLSEEVGIAFMSSPSIPKTAIDLTCGSKQTLQSVPYGFNAAPPFYLTIEGVMSDGSVVTISHTFSSVS